MPNGQIVRAPATAAAATVAWQARPPLSRVAVARVVQLAGVLDILTVIVPAHHDRFAKMGQFVPYAGIVTARTALTVVGVLLLYLGLGLRRGKRRAWQIATGVAALGIVLHLTKGGPAYISAALSAGLLVLLIAERTKFQAEPDPRGRWRAVRLFFALLGAGFALGLAETALRAGHGAAAFADSHPFRHGPFPVDHSGFVGWMEEAALGLFGITGPVHFAHEGSADLVSMTTGTFGLLAVASAVVVLLRPGIRRDFADAEQQGRLRGLLDRFGSGDSLGYFALRADKSLIWSPDNMAAVAYRVINGVSLASGDPIGPESAWPAAIDAWLDDSARHGWTPAVLGCGEAGGRAYRKRGLDVVELGDEAVVEVAEFRLEGRPMRGVRQAVNRVGRAGYTCQVAREHDLPPEVLAEAIRAAERFRDGQVERGYSMALSRVGDPRDDTCVLALARDGDGTLRGLLQFVPWGTEGLSLDLMRGDRAAENGLTEFMIAETIAAAPGLGVARVSLNFAVLRSVFARADQLGAGPVLRLWHRLLTFASAVWQIESLYRANAKYLPRWQPRYLCFPTARDLPRIAVAALAAERFLPEPISRIMEP